MSKQLENMRRQWDGYVFHFDSRFGAYGRKAQAKRDAQQRAAVIRRRGEMARVTYEKMDYGVWWVVWRVPGETRRRGR